MAPWPLKLQSALRLALIVCVGLAVAACNDDRKREVKDIKAEVQRAFGARDFKQGLALSQKGLVLAREVIGDDAPDTLYFIQAITETTLAQGNQRGAIAALKNEIAMRKAAGQPESKLQPRRTLLIKLAEDNNDKLTAGDQAVEVSRGIEMARGKDPQPVYRTETAYPPELYQQKIEGDVQIAYSLDRAGAVVDARVVTSTPARVFDEAALASFKQWRFTPMLDSEGKAISGSGFKFTLAFRLQK